jgi:hypothetical protein
MISAMPFPFRRFLNGRTGKTERFSLKEPVRLRGCE